MEHLQLRHKIDDQAPFWHRFGSSSPPPKPRAVTAHSTDPRRRRQNSSCLMSIKLQNMPTVYHRQQGSRHDHAQSSPPAPDSNLDLFVGRLGAHRKAHLGYTGLGSTRNIHERDIDPSEPGTENRSSPSNAGPESDQKLMLFRRMDNGKRTRYRSAA
jgi:hypothetical protein